MVNAKVKNISKILVMAFAGLLMLGLNRPAFAGTFTSLYSLPYPGLQGQGPYGGVIINDNILYGTTALGGASTVGTIFRINANGTGYTVLHTFTGINGDGGESYSNLTLSGSTLYGVTSAGGANNGGTIFSINTNGTGYTVLRSLAGADGTGPVGSLTLGDGKLYGVAFEGGDYSKGTIFSIDTDGTDYTVLRSFSGEGEEGESPARGLILNGSTLYGTTYGGGTYNEGTIFSINTNGTGYTVLRSLTGADGINPASSLTLNGSTLYGTTIYGGTYNKGTIFSINTGGTGFAVLHSLTEATDGTLTYGGLTLSGSTLYGTASYGGAYGDDGTIFSINTNGTGFTVLRSFTGAGDGGRPFAGLTLSGDILYGTTWIGGADGYGSIFSYNISGGGASPEPATMISGLLGLLGFAIKRFRFTKK